ncbi:hypothetical protein J2S00_003070 [Caldalkalibacillus uzonensis]|uniref:Uncharacterized protein n=1 Tax=Caldalkalibacillus uzonensis TaxID=353224 RepID=A0ABU0CV64_9BACI|nr:hypothetical protein [Caldalkalibacillus uzonensis]MDQ0340265.1 hypothetical protein [Caldalkalibacillus uzonensis]
MNKVLKTFRCKVTKKIYRAGSVYDGERAEELQALGFVEVHEPEPEWPKHIGGGKYELSNGETVKGKQAAFTAQAELDETVNEDGESQDADTPGE